jgi:hypothetical protein
MLTTGRRALHQRGRKEPDYHYAMGLVMLLFSGPEIGLIRRMINQMHSRSGPGSRRSDRTNSRRIRRGASAIEFGRDGYLRRLLS